MAPELKRVDKLAIASKEMLVVGNKLFRMIQVLPCIPSEYTELAEQFLFLPICLENLHMTLKAIAPEDDDDEEKDNNQHEKLFEDIDKLLDFLEVLHETVENALPERWEDEVEYELPLQSRSLIVQIQATESVSNMLLAVMRLGIIDEDTETSESDKVPPILSRYRLLAETTISSVKGAIRRLACNTPIAPRSEKQPPSPMYKRHMDLKEWLERLLLCWEVKPKSEAKEEEQSEEQVEDATEKVEDATEKPDDKEKTVIISKDDPKMDRIQTIGRDARADGMPPGVPYDPNAVYVRINKKHLDQRTLEFFGLPWSVVKEDPDYYVIWQSLSLRESDELFEHTKRIRMLDEQGAIEPAKAVDALLKRWLDAEALVEPDSEMKKQRDEDLEQFEKDLEDLKVDANKPSPVRRPIGPSAPPPPPGRPKPFKGTTDYWKPWSEDSWSLYSSMKRNGWKPIYMRGNDSGQTWFAGEKVMHVRRFKEDYTPQDQPAKSENLEKGQKAYLIIGKQWVEEESIIRSGFSYRSVKDSWALDPRLTWFDIDILTAATSAFREERLFRKYRNLPGGDLHEQVRVVFPDDDYLQGPGLSSFGYANMNLDMPQPVQHHHQIDITARAHVPSRLDEIIEETPVQEAPVHEAPAQVVRSPTIESHDSFVEVEK